MPGNEVIATISAEVRFPHTIFGKVVSPRWMHTDYMERHFINAIRKSDKNGAYSGAAPALYFEPRTRSLILAPALVPADMVKGDYTFGTASKWDVYPQQSDVPGGKKVLAFVDAGIGTSDFAQSVNNIVADPHGTNQAFFYLYLRCAALPMGSNPATQGRTLSARWGTVSATKDGGTKKTPDRFTLNFAQGAAPWLAREFVDATGNTVLRVYPAANETAARELFRDFLAGGVLVRVMTLSRGRERLEVDVDGNPTGGVIFREADMLVEVMSGAGEVMTFFLVPDVTVQTSQLRIDVANGVAWFAYYPIRFGNFIQGGRMTGTYESDTKIIGYVPDAEAISAFTAEVDAFEPAGSSVSVVFGSFSPANTEFNYVASLQAPDAGSGYATTTPVLKNITTIFPLVERQDTELTAIDLSVKAYQVSTMFNLDTLNWQTSGYLELENFYGSDQVKNQQVIELEKRGTMGLILDLKVLSDVVAGNENVVLATGRALTGHCNFRRSYNLQEGRSSCYVRFADRMKQLADVVVEGGAPVMDGVCHFKAVRFWLEYAGISPRFMPPAVRDDEDGLGDQHYHLPLGDGLNPLMVNRPGTPIANILARIASQTKFAWGFDGDGNFVYNELPFKKLLSDDPGLPPETVKRFRLVPQVATTVDSVTIASLDQIWTVGNYEVSLESTSNVVKIIGMDPVGNRPIPAFVADNESLSDSRKFNHIPYRKTFAWIDSLFSSTEVAQNVAQTLYNLLRLPTMTIAFETWLQPQLKVLDIIEIEGGKLPVSPLLKFWILGLTHTCDAYSRIPRTQIYARALPFSPGGLEIGGF